MRVFSTLRQLCVLVLMLLSVPLALPPEASAQDASWCAEAEGLAAGTDLYGYTVVYGTGGAGSQIVLGYGGGTLSGGSGNDVLCAWGGGNTLDGGSGNDTLIVISGLGNELYGGSGNDTLIGFAYDYFDGGSGRNSITAQPVVMQAWLVPGGQNQDGQTYFAVSGSGFAPGSSVEVAFDMYYIPTNEWAGPTSSQTKDTIVDVDGTFLAVWGGFPFVGMCSYDTYFSGELDFIITVVDTATSSLVYTSERLDLNCS